MKLKKAEKWYVVQVSDTTMFNSCSKACPKNKP